MGRRGWRIARRRRICRHQIRMDYRASGVHMPRKRSEYSCNRYLDVQKEPYFSGAYCATDTYKADCAKNELHICWIPTQKFMNFFLLSIDIAVFI